MTNFLTQSNDGGDFLPYIMWGSDAVTWYKKGEDGKEAFEPTQAVFDMENLQVGWIGFIDNVPNKVMAQYQSETPAKPEGKTTNLQGKEVDLYSRGFSVNVLFGKEFGDQRLHEFSASQKGSTLAVGALIEEYEANKGANEGKLPVVEFGKHEHVKLGKGSTNKPGLRIVSWVDRPEELPEGNVIAIQSDSVAETQVEEPVAKAGGVSEF